MATGETRIFDLSEVNRRGRGRRWAGGILAIFGVAIVEPLFLLQLAASYATRGQASSFWPQSGIAYVALAVAGGLAFPAVAIWQFRPLPTVLTVCGDGLSFRDSSGRTRSFSWREWGRSWTMTRFNDYPGRSMWANSHVSCKGMAIAHVPDAAIPAITEQLSQAGWRISRQQLPDGRGEVLTVTGPKAPPPK